MILGNEKEKKAESGMSLTYVPAVMYVLQLCYSILSTEEEREGRRSEVDRS